jgi:transposase
MGRVRPEYKTPKKSHFFHLLEHSQTPSAAAKELKIDRTTAWRWTRRHDPTEPERTTRRRLATKKLGRPYTVTDEYINQMIQWITGHYDRRILSLETIAQEACGIKAKYPILLRAWHRWGYHHHTPDSKPFLSAAQKLVCFTFVVKHWDRPVEYWRKGIYTDETVARTNLRRRVKVLRKRGERRYLDCIQFTFNSGCDSIMCWAAIGYNFKSNLYFVSMNGQGKGFIQKKYEQQILRGLLKEIFKERYYQGFFCIEDGSKVHRLKDSRRNQGLCNSTRVECYINTLIDWPGNSPDLNPIENIWRVLKQRLRSRNPYGSWSLEQLKEALIDI